MARRNAQDSYNAACIMWDQMRDPNMEPEPTPKSVQPNVVLRRHGNTETRRAPKSQAAFLACQLRMERNG